MLTHLPAPYEIGQWVFGGKSTQDFPLLYRIEEGKRIDRGMTPMDAARSPWGPDMRRSRYDEDDDDDFEEDEFDDDEDLDEDELDDDDLFDDDDDVEDDEFFEDDEDEDLF